MRVGIIVTIVPDKKIGFIRSPDLHEDVFFHFSKVQETPNRKELEQGDEVEYEIDELSRLEKRRLQATVVRRPARPLTRRLLPHEAPELKARHHPKARRKRPSWREGSGEDGPDETETG